MTYEQSLKNIEIIKNFASPLEGYFSYYKFKNDTEFDLMFIIKDFKSKEFGDYEDMKREGCRADLPFASAGFNKTYCLTLQYDDTVLHFMYDLSQNILLDHSLKELPRNSKGLKESFLELIKLLKNK